MIFYNNKLLSYINEHWKSLNEDEDQKNDKYVEFDFDAKIDNINDKKDQELLAILDASIDDYDKDSVDGFNASTFNKIAAASAAAEEAAENVSPQTPPGPRDPESAV